MSAPQSEDSILAILDEFFPREHHSLALGRGDDCAVLESRGRLILSSDIFAEDSHFRRRYFSPADIGYKALAVNLSDLAAAGALPLAFSLCLTLTGREDEDWLRGFALGMSELAKAYDVGLSGGDIARAATLNIAITAWGESARNSQCVILRNQGKVGDLIYVIGQPGLARVGLSVLEAARNAEEVALAKAAWPQACMAHLRPKPKLEQGLEISVLAMEYQRDYPDCRFSLMDVSDGLARDLPRLLGRPRSGRGAEISLDEDMLAPEVLAYCRERDLDPVTFAFEGGEDYALLGTCPERALSRLAKLLPGQVTPLGRVTAGGDLTLNGQPVSGRGFDHFS